MTPQTTLGEGTPLDGSNYGDPEDERPDDVGPACDGCERREAVTSAGPLDLCSTCAGRVGEDLAPSPYRDTQTSMELHTGVEEVTVRVDGEERHNYYREGGDGVEVVVEFPGGGSA